MAVDPISFRPTAEDAKAMETIKTYLNLQHREPGSGEWTDGRIIRWAILTRARELSGYAADAKPPAVCRPHRADGKPRTRTAKES